MDKQCAGKIARGIEERNGTIYQPIDSLLTPEDAALFDHLIKRVQRTDCALRLDYILEHLAGNSVLDIGCSEGYFSYKIASKGYTVTAIDRNGTMLRMTESLVTVNALEVTCHVCNWEDLFQDSVYYDNVLMLSVFHHTIEEHGDKAFALLARLKGKVGRVFLEAEWDQVNLALKDALLKVEKALDMETLDVWWPNEPLPSVCRPIMLLVPEGE